MTDSNDILICAEFKQILGPSIIFTIPQHPRVQSKSIQETTDLLNQLTLKAMSMKFTFDDHQEPQSQSSPYNDDSYIIMEFDELKRYTCLWYFTYLPDLSARGFARRIGLAYISPFKEKLIKHMNCISYGFQQTLLCLKFPLCAVYRYEAVQYADIIDRSINTIKQKLTAIDEQDEVKEQLQKLIINYSAQGLEELIRQLIDLKFFLINTHSLLCMHAVPIFYQLYQTEEIIDTINYSEFATIQYDIKYLSQHKKLIPHHIVPENYHQIVIVPPHELRIQKRQELRTLEQLVGSGFFGYFKNVLTLIFNYFSQTIADLEFSEIINQYNTQHLIENRRLAGIWFGQKFFLPCELDEAFALSYTFQPLKRYKELFIEVRQLRLKEHLEQDENYEILELGSGQESILQANLPYKQVTDKFYIAYYSMFPYLPSLASLSNASNLTRSLPSYGQLLNYFVTQFNPRIVRNLLTQILSGCQIVVLTDNAQFALLLQQIIDPFILNRQFQQFRCVLDEFSDLTTVSQLVHQISMFHYDPNGGQIQQHIDRFIHQLVKQTRIALCWFDFHRRIATCNGASCSCSIVEDILLQKDNPTIFTITRRLECCFRRFVLDSLYSDRFPKVYKESEDAAIQQRIKDILSSTSELGYKQLVKRRVDETKIECSFMQGLRECGLQIMNLNSESQ